MAKKVYYNRKQIVDAREHYERAWAAGVLSWGTWDHAPRPVEHRIADFCDAFPPEDPVKNLGGSARRGPTGDYAPGDRSSRLERFLADDWRPGSIHALLATYGLKLRGGPAPLDREVLLAPFKAVARRRNAKLRVLHGSIDESPENMDAAKADYLDKRERQAAAKQIREARKRMRRELDKP